MAQVSGATLGPWFLEFESDLIKNFNPFNILTDLDHVIENLSSARISIAYSSSDRKLGLLV